MGNLMFVIISNVPSFIQRVHTHVAYRVYTVAGRK